MCETDPFRHYPKLRSLVKPPAESFFLDMHPDRVRAMARENGLSDDWIMDDDERDADRAATMAERWGRDLWVFGYGSLMWDPGIRFAEVRRAFAREAARRFILYDVNGARGTQDAPGLMAALDAGEGCHGLVFRIPAARLESETFSLWSRERIAHAYLSHFIEVQTDFGPIEALTFMANHDRPSIRGDLTHEEQVQLIATGVGHLGTSRDYLESLATHLAEFDIDDPEVTRLLADVRSYGAP